ncbi:hypothetical protein I3760_16G091800 [Carya illinoinensis]|nr:hypothetical protein I3760_16G091800 [Carya illinoinensis]
MVGSWGLRLLVLLAGNGSLNPYFPKFTLPRSQPPIYLTPTFPFGKHHLYLLVNGSCCSDTHMIRPASLAPLSAIIDACWSQFCK